MMQLWKYESFAFELLEHERGGAGGNRGCILSIALKFHIHAQILNYFPMKQILKCKSLLNLYHLLG